MFRWTFFGSCIFLLRQTKLAFAAHKTRQNIFRYGGPWHIYLLFKGQMGYNPWELS